jgi:DNA (cytosine-5)-methyltransferase 1
MRHGSLFSGIGGFDLAAEWMGWENVFHCEWMEFPRKVLDYYWPDADSHIDICKTDFKKYANRIDILTGGFPCQPFSLAGKRKGTNDERYLWGEMLRAIQEIKPKWVIAENVFGIVNIDGGMVFEQVCLDLEAEGYEVQPFIIPAAAKNAPHRRDRVWFVAYSDKCSKRSPGKSTSIKRNGSNINDESRQWRESTQFNTGCNEFLRNAANTNCDGLNQCNGNDEINASERGFDAQRNFEPIYFEQSFIEYSNGIRQKWRMHAEQSEITTWEQFSKRNARSVQPTNWENFPTQSPICSGDDGLPTKLDGITFPKWRNESVKGYGNAIVPQIALQLFQIIEHESKNKNT